MIGTFLLDYELSRWEQIDQESNKVEIFLSANTLVCRFQSDKDRVFLIFLINGKEVCRARSPNVVGHYSPLQHSSCFLLLINSQHPILA